MKNILIVTVFTISLLAYIEKVRAYDPCDDMMVSIECFMGPGFGNSRERRDREEQLEIQRQMLIEKQKQTQLMRNHNENNYNSYGYDMFNHSTQGY